MNLADYNRTTLIRDVLKHTLKQEFSSFLKWYPRQYLSPQADLQIRLLLVKYQGQKLASGKFNHRVLKRALMELREHVWAKAAFVYFYQSRQPGFSIYQTKRKGNKRYEIIDGVFKAIAKEENNDGYISVASAGGFKTNGEANRDLPSGSISPNWEPYTPRFTSFGEADTPGSMDDSGTADSSKI